jgi:hypothetical protein
MARYSRHYVVEAAVGAAEETAEAAEARRMARGYSNHTDVEASVGAADATEEEAVADSQRRSRGYSGHKVGCTAWHALTCSYYEEGYTPGTGGGGGGGRSGG